MYALQRKLYIPFLYYRSLSVHKQNPNQNLIKAHIDIQVRGNHALDELKRLYGIPGMYFLHTTL